MLRPLALALSILGAAAACADSAPEPPVPSVRALITQQLNADTRPDSFTQSADLGRVLGNAAAPVWVVVVGDFQCEECKRWNDEVFPLIRTEYVTTGRIRLAYVNMPLAAHLNGTASALAAVCASAQGKFWETYARIFATQSRWKDLPDARPFLDSLAVDAGADAATQRVCTERARALKLIRQDSERSRAAAVESLPTFFIGTHRRVGNAPIAAFRAVIDSALAGK